MQVHIFNCTAISRYPPTSEGRSRVSVWCLSHMRSLAIRIRLPSSAHPGILQPILVDPLILGRLASPPLPPSLAPPYLNRAVVIPHFFFALRPEQNGFPAFHLSCHDHATHHADEYLRSPASLRITNNYYIGLHI